MSPPTPGTILAAGAAVQLLTGLPAAWGVFQQPVMEEYALGEGAAAAAFSVLIAAYGVGCVIGGFLQDKQGPRCAALWGTGLLCAGLFGAAAPQWGIRGAFLALECAALPVCLAGAALLTDPPAAGQKAPDSPAVGPDYTPARMLRTRQYWLCTASVCFSTPAVLLFSPIILRLGNERGLAEGEAVWAVVLGSVGSTAGRLLIPLLSDRIGRRPTDLLLFGASCALSAGFAFARGWAVVGVYAGLTFCYSALSAVLPAFSTDLFGLPHAGVNYGFLALGQSAGSLLFPLAARLLGLEMGRHWLALAAAAAGFGCIWFLRPARRPGS